MTTRLDPDSSSSLLQPKKLLHHIPPNLPQELAFVLSGYRRARALWCLVLDLSRTVLLVGSFVLACLLFDRFVDVEGKWRVPLPVIAGVLLVGFLVRAVARASRRPDYDRIAWTLDRASGDRRDHLRTILDFAQAALTRNFFVESSRRAAVRQWEGLRYDRFVQNRRPRQYALAAGAFLVILAALWHIPYLRTDLLWRRFLHPTGNYMRPSATWFQVENPPPTDLRAGDDLVIRARLMGQKIESPSPLLRVLQADGSSVTRSLSPTSDGAWNAELQNLQQDFEWFLFMDDARSERYSIRVLPRPTVVQTTVTYDFPEYARMKSKTEVLKGRTITALDGTRIKLKLRSNVKLAKAQGSTDEDTFRFRINSRQPEEALLHLILTKNQKMKIDLVSLDGVESKQELPFTFRVIPDSSPTISIKNQLDGESFYITDILEIDYRAQDDLGLSEILVMADVPKEKGHESGTATIEVPLEEYGVPVAEGTFRVPVSDLLGVNADQLNLRMVAKDTKDQEGASRSVTLKIATDSFDRQLRFLLKSYRGEPQQHDAAVRGESSLSNHANLLTALKTAKARLDVLIDSLDEKGPVGENQAELVSQVQGELSRVRPGFSYGSYWFFDFQNAALPPRFREYGEYAVCWSRFGLDGHSMRERFSQAIKAPQPKAELQKLVPLLDEAIERQTKIAGRVQADYLAIVRELVGYLASALENSLTHASDKSWLDPGFVTQCQGTLKEILSRTEADVKDELPEPIRKTLQEAVEASDAKGALTNLLPTLHQLKQSLSRRAAEAVSLRMQEQPILRESLAAMEFQSQVPIAPLAVGLYLGADNVDDDELFLLQTAMHFLQRYAGRPGPFQPLGDPDETLREREEASFRLFQALQRLRAQAEELRLGLETEKLRYGQPEFDAQWLALRECRFALLESAQPSAAREGILRQPLSDLAASSELLESWHVPRDVSPAELAARLAHWEKKCAECSASLLPEVQTLLGKLDRDLAERLKDFKPAVDALRGDIQSEIANLEKTKDPIGLDGIRNIKVRLKALHVIVIKSLDFAELAQIYHSGHSVSLELLSTLHLILAKTVQEFERKIESRAAHHATRFGDLSLQAWSVKVEEYRRLDALLASILELLAQPDPPTLEKLIADQHLTHQHKQEQEAVQAALAAEDRLRNRKQLLDDLANDKEDSSALWAEIFHLLYQTREALGSQGDEKELRSLMASLETGIKNFDPLPKEMKNTVDFLSECREGPVSDEERRKDLFSRASALVQDLRPLAQMPERRIMQYVRDFYGWIGAIDLSALTRAKIRSQKQIFEDRHRVKRNMASMALQWNGLQLDTLYWAVGESELNRRKASLTLDQIGLGGIALASDSLDDLKLPKHLYQELKRARSGPMPPLYRDECYDYLNRILQKAR